MNEREKLRERGRDVADRLGLDVPDGAPELDRFALEAACGALWADPALGLADRMVAALSAAAHRHPESVDAGFLRSAIRAGLEPREIQETIVQCGLYGGLPLAVRLLRTANGVFAEDGLEPEGGTAPARGLDALEADGRALLAGLHGARSEDGYASPGNAATAGLYREAIRYGYGEIWHRPGLSHRRRLIVALASFAALGLGDTLRKFTASALAFGLTAREVVAAVSQIAPYAGFPVALDALGRIADIVADAGQADP